MVSDMMADHNREVDDLDYLLCDALWSNHDAAPDPARVLASLRTRINQERQPALTSWSPVASGPCAHMSASYWYFMPLLRAIR